jgi:hypothetical protein
MSRPPAPARVYETRRISSIGFAGFAESTVFHTKGRGYGQLAVPDVPLSQMTESSILQGFP